VYGLAFIGIDAVFYKKQKQGERLGRQTLESTLSRRSAPEIQLEEIRQERITGSFSPTGSHQSKITERGNRSIDGSRTFLDDRNSIEVCDNFQCRYAKALIDTASY
jgi:hypothetical protein